MFPVLSHFAVFGLEDKKRLDGSPDCIPPRINDEDEDGDDDVNGGDDSIPPPDGMGAIGEEKEKEPKEIARRANGGGTLNRYGVRRPTEYWKEAKDAKPNDGVVYFSEIGEWIRLRKPGRTYKVGEDGRRLIFGSPRPIDDYTCGEWKKLSSKDRDVIKNEVEGGC